MRFELLIAPDYVLRWDGGSIWFDDREGAILARLARGRAASFMDLVGAVYYHRPIDPPDGDPLALGFLPSVTLAIARIEQKLLGTPFHITLSGSNYHFGSRLDRIADAILREGNMEEDRG